MSEWLKVMLEEVARKEEEAAADREEQQRRQRAQAADQPEDQTGVDEASSPSK